MRWDLESFAAEELPVCSRFLFCPLFIIRQIHARSIAKLERVRIIPEFLLRTGAIGIQKPFDVVET